MEARIWSEQRWIKETDPHVLKNNLADLLNLCGFEILDFVEHEFEAQGYTALWLLGESHFAVHTFPEENKTYIELSSCNGEKHGSFVANLDIQFKKL